MLSTEAMSWIEENKSRIIALSDAIWELAEVGLQEHGSSTLLADELQKAGFHVQRMVADMPTAFVATYGQGRPLIGILGEYDALPGLSQKPIPKREPISPGAPGHGCGHNIHGTSGAAAAIAVKNVMKEHNISGTIKFFGCPAEETLVGKVFMAREGVFDGLDAVLSHHPGCMNAASLVSSNAMNSVKLHFHGKASHAGGSPEQGRSALDAVELMNIGVNYLREHIIQEARIHYVIEDGGHEPNIVPAYARSWYYIRAPEREQVERIYEWVLRIADGADLIAGTTHKIEFLTACYNTLPNVALSELIVAKMREIGVPSYSEDELLFAHEIAKTITPAEKMEALRRSKRPMWEKLLDVEMDTSFPDPWGLGESSGGSTDVGDVSRIAPTVEFSTAAYPLGTPGHSWQRVACSRVGLGHKSLIFAAKVMASVILELFTQPEQLARVKKEFEERTKGAKYVPPIPKDLKPPFNQLPQYAAKK